MSCIKLSLYFILLLVPSVTFRPPVVRTSRSIFVRSLASSSFRYLPVSERCGALTVLQSEIKDADDAEESLESVADGIDVSDEVDEDEEEEEEDEIRRELRQRRRMWLPPKGLDHAERLRWKFDFLLRALEAYRQVFRSTLVPRTFVFPLGDHRFPEEVWGFPLGTRYAAVKKLGAIVIESPEWNAELEERGFEGWEFLKDKILTPELRQKLNEHRFSNTTADPKDVGTFEELLKASVEGKYPAEISEMVLAAATLVHMHARGERYIGNGWKMAAPLEIEASSSWPQYLWGFPAHDKLSLLRRRQRTISNTVPALAEKLWEIGFYTKLRKTPVHERLLLEQVLKIYFKQTGNFAVPASFTVPLSDEWPVCCHGVRYGRKVVTFRNRLTENCKDEDEAELLIALWLNALRQEAMEIGDLREFSKEVDYNFRKGPNPAVHDLAISRARKKIEDGADKIPFEIDAPQTLQEYFSGKTLKDMWKKKEPSPAAAAGEGGEDKKSRAGGKEAKGKGVTPMSQETPEEGGYLSEKRKNVRPLEDVVRQIDLNHVVRDIDGNRLPDDWPTIDWPGPDEIDNEPVIYPTAESDPWTNLTMDQLVMEVAKTISADVPSYDPAEMDARGLPSWPPTEEDIKNDCRIVVEDTSLQEQHYQAAIAELSSDPDVPIDEYLPFSLDDEEEEPAAEPAAEKRRGRELPRGIKRLPQTGDELKALLSEIREEEDEYPKSKRVPSISNLVVPRRSPKDVKRQTGLYQRTVESLGPLERKPTREEEEGGIFDELFDWKWDDLIEGMQFFADVYDTDFGEIPPEFVVNEGYIEAGWPAEWKGFPLGKFTQSLRYGDIDAKLHWERRPALDKLGYDWGTGLEYLNFSFHKFFHSCMFLLKITHALKLLHQIAAMPVISPTTPYASMRGYKVGYVLRKIWRQESVLYYFHPEKFDLFVRVLKLNMQNPWMLIHGYEDRPHFELKPLHPSLWTDHAREPMFEVPEPPPIPPHVQNPYLPDRPKKHNLDVSHAGKPVGTGEGWGEYWQPLF
uniref:Helicase-associated domain-containing protein n=1 Tax=Chromera velia CCMP2878 TaxID=1169474 RepID=A0A0G4H926_9ALVE|eukprot:Cvel_5902.t1-p1 / transcript=Cvel_5902.t1 / gene=Cvel_5902 / organism=Chromera_velia_CCMP2878 / gene_product=hypothetical protein / transcript_product=hypothetical protein / location=Cvel_scaffold281:92953-96030(+) / protein_length=1026 / sequence_SO=supercontig / SO=protein_coding / is_pseudo=false